MGTQPTLWAKVDLTFKLYSADHQARNVFKAERDVREIGVQIEDFDGTLHICAWREELRMVLTLPRLGLLKHLTLGFFIESVMWRDCIDILQLVSSLAPSVRKLSWRHATINPDPNPTPVDAVAQQLVDQMVKFEKVHFLHFDSPSSFDEGCHLDSTFHLVGNGINSAIMKALSAVVERKGHRLK